MSVPVALFARVSTTRQDTDRQLADLRACADKLGYQVVATFTETISGSKRLADRPELQQLLALATAGQIRKVLVTEISRLGRRTVEVLQVVELLTELRISVYVQSYGVETILPNGRKNPFASLLFTMLAEFAQLERETTRERIISGLEQARRRGVQLGREKGQVKTGAAMLEDYPKVVRLLKEQHSIRNISTLAGVSGKTVLKVKRLLETAELNKKVVGSSLSKSG